MHQIESGANEEWLPVAVASSKTGIPQRTIYAYVAAHRESVHSKRDDSAGHLLVHMPGLQAFAAARRAASTPAAQPGETAAEKPPEGRAPGTVNSSEDPVLRARRDLELLRLEAERQRLLSELEAEREARARAEAETHAERALADAERAHRQQRAAWELERDRVHDERDRLERARVLAAEERRAFDESTLANARREADARREKQRLAAETEWREWRNGYERSVVLVVGARHGAAAADAARSLARRILAEYGPGDDEAASLAVMIALRAALAG